MNQYSSKTAQDVCNLASLVGGNRKAVLEEVFGERYPNAISRIIVDCELQGLLGQYSLEISISDYNILNKHVFLLVWLLINYGFNVEVQDTRKYHNVSGAVIKVQWGQYKGGVK